MKPFKFFAAFWLLASVCAFAQVQAFISGNITSSGASCSSGATNCLLMPLPDKTASISITVTGTFNATLQFEISGDNNTTYVSVSGPPKSGGAPVSSTTTTGVWVIAASGFNYFRVRASAYTSGTATVSLQASNAPLGASTTFNPDANNNIGVIVNNAAPGGAIPVNLGTGTIGGDATVTGIGNSGANIPRFTVANDSFGQQVVLQASQV